MWLAVVLGFVGFVTSFGAHIVAVNLPSYAETVGAGLAIIGLLIAVYDLAEIVAKPVFGALADRRGMKQTMLAGIALFTLASLLFPFLDPRLLLLVRFTQGVGAAALSAVSLALVAVYFSERRGRAYGVYNAMKGLGYVIAPVAGGAMVVTSGFAKIFLLTAAVGAIAFVASAFLPRPGRAGDLDEDDDLTWSGFIDVFRDRLLLPWYAVTVLSMFFVGILFGFLPVRVHNLGYSPLASGVLLTVVSASYLAIQPAAGALADRIPGATTIRVGLAAAAASITAVPFVSGPALAATSIVAGFGVGVVWTNTDTLISTLAARGRLGATMGAAGSFKELGDMIGPITVGALSQALGLGTGFVICGTAGLVSLLFLRSFPTGAPAANQPANR